MKNKSFKINKIIHEGTNFDSSTDLASALARQFSHTSSSANYHPAFLTIKEAAEPQPIHFATGDNFDYNKGLTMDELDKLLMQGHGTNC